MSNTAALDDAEIVDTAAAVAAAAQAKSVALDAEALVQDQAALLFVLSAPVEDAVDMLNTELLHPAGISISGVTEEKCFHTVELLSPDAFALRYNPETINKETVREGNTLLGLPFDSPVGFEQPGSVGLAINLVSGTVVSFHEGPIVGNLHLRGGRVEKIEAGAVHEFTVKVHAADERLDLLMMGKVIGVTILIVWGLRTDKSSTFTTGGLAVIVTYVMPDGTTGYQVRRKMSGPSVLVCLSITGPTPPYTTSRWSMADTVPGEGRSR
jgi:hypothetical protein